MLYLVSIFLLVVGMLILKAFVENRVPELKGKIWNLNDLKEHEHTYRIARNILCLLIVFSGAILLLNGFM